MSKFASGGRLSSTSFHRVNEYEFLVESKFIRKLRFSGKNLNCLIIKQCFILTMRTCPHIRVVVV